MISDSSDNEEYEEVDDFEIIKTEGYEKINFFFNFREKIKKQSLIEKIANKVLDHKISDMKSISL